MVESFRELGGSFLIIGNLNSEIQRNLDVNVLLFLSISLTHSLKYKNVRF